MLRRNRLQEIVLVVLAVLALTIALGAQQAQPPAKGTEYKVPPEAAQKANPVKPSPESLAKAKKLYAIDCAMCHGDNGNGKTDIATSMELTLDDWTDPKTLAGREDWELFNVIRVGKDKMPPESSGRATDNEVWNLIIYLRTFSKSQPPAAAPAQ